MILFIILNKMFKILKLKISTLQSGMTKSLSFTVALKEIVGIGISKV